MKLNVLKKLTPNEVGYLSHCPEATAKHYLTRVKGINLTPGATLELAELRKIKPPQREIASKEAFTIAHGMSYQANDLAFWEALLKPEIYAQLLGVVMEETERRLEAGKLKTGYDVPRGQALDSWLKNINNDYNPLRNS